MTVIRAVLMIVLFTVISGCGGDNWEGIVFPNKNKMLMFSSNGPFETLDECKNASMEKLESKNALDTGFYECGKNCKAGSSSYNRGCEDTERGNLYK